MKTVFYFLMLLVTSGLRAQDFSLLAENAAGPWGQEDGTGAGNEIVVAAFAAAGKTVHLETMPYVRAKFMVLEGLALGCFGMAWSDELEGKVVFPSRPIYTTVTTFFVNKAAKNNYRKVSDLPKGLIVGTVRGYEYPPAFQKLVKDGFLIPRENNSEIQNLEMLSLGRIDLAVTELDELKNADILVRRAGAKDLVEIAFPLESSGTFVGFAINNPSTAVALETFDSGMARIIKNGVYADIIRRWEGKLK